MSQFLKYSDVDQEIQNRMSSQSPTSGKIEEAVLTVMDDLNAKYDLETTKRKETVSIINDGSTPYKVSDIITDDDVKRIKTVKFPAASDSGQPEFRWVDNDQFCRHVADGIHVNEFTTYFEDGIMMININAYDNSSTVVSMDVIYFSFNNVITGAGVFQNEIADIEIDELLVPKRFKPLIVSGALIKLWPMALGEDGEGKAGRNLTFFKDQLIDLGLDQTGHDIKREQKKFKIHKPY